MNRSNYSDDCDGWALIRWRGAVNAAIRGKRGQALLREMLKALDAMPKKELYPGNFKTPEGEFCALGVLGNAKGIRLDDLGDESDCEPEFVGQRFGIAKALAAEIMYLNDESTSDRKWIDVEICGPMREHYPDWGVHKRTVSIHDKSAPQKRWAYVRQWVARKVKTEEVSTS